MGKSSTPPAPDYAAAAEKTAAGNLEAVRAQSAANRVNQYTPQGSLVYSHSPAESFDQQAYDAAMANYNNQLANYNSRSSTLPWFGLGGLSSLNGRLNRSTAPTMPNRSDYVTSDPDSGWAATQTYSPEQQGIYESNTRLSQGLLDTAESGLGTVNELLADPTIDESKLPQFPVNAGESYMDAAMRYMQPSQDRQREALRTQLVNQGFGMDSEGYQGAMSDLVDQFDRAKLQAIMGGMDKGMTARQNALQEQSYFQDRPLNIINALRTGNQVQGPQFTNVPQQSFAPGADYLEATNSQYNAALQGANAKNAANANMMNGLFSLGSAAIPFFL